MWHWDQGHLPYFQFDAIQQLARLAVDRDFMTVTQQQAYAATRLEFAAPPSHSPWRNYSRALKLCMLVSNIEHHARPTEIAQRLAIPGRITCDEYLHFLACVSTDPSPALQGWTDDSSFRYPLVFSLKYILAKHLSQKNAIISLDEIIGAYARTNAEGSETLQNFYTIAAESTANLRRARQFGTERKRQAKESLRVISQLSYLYLGRGGIAVNLVKGDAEQLFRSLQPIAGLRKSTADAEIQRLGATFDASTQYSVIEALLLNTTPDNGFPEGTKISKTHLVIERNTGLRKAFFTANSHRTICDSCEIDTKSKYPWADRILDLHHLLPLSAGARIVGQQTTLEDLTAICPTCHRAIHKFYADWLKSNRKNDFSSKEEAIAVYTDAKTCILANSDA